jgi:flavorubredoxin
LLRDYARASGSASAAAHATTGLARCARGNTPMTKVTEIAPDTFRISTYIPEFDLQFNQFVILDDEPLLFHTGMRGLFPLVRDAVATVVEPSSIRWLGFSHFEADECGALNEWQALAPNSTAVCSLVGKLVSVDDFAPGRPALGMSDGEVLSTGKYRFRFVQTPHVPHCWDAGLLFEETQGTLLCSDLLHQSGDLEAQTSDDVVGRFESVLRRYQQGPLANYMPYTSQTDRILQSVAALKPRTLATMHGSTFVGDGERAIGELAGVIRDVMGP